MIYISTVGCPSLAALMLASVASATQPSYRLSNVAMSSNHVCHINKFFGWYFMGSSKSIQSLKPSARTTNTTLKLILDSKCFGIQNDSHLPTISAFVPTNHTVNRILAINFRVSMNKTINMDKRSNNYTH